MFWKKKSNLNNVWHTCPKCPKFKTTSMNTFYYHSDLYHGTSYLPAGEVEHNKYISVLRQDLTSKFPTLKTFTEKDLRIANRKLIEEDKQKLVSKVESKLSDFIICTDEKKVSVPVSVSTPEPVVSWDAELIEKLEEQVNKVLVNLDLLEKCLLETAHSRKGNKEENVLNEQNNEEACIVVPY